MCSNPTRKYYLTEISFTEKIGLKSELYVYWLLLKSV